MDPLDHGSLLRRHTGFPDISSSGWGHCRIMPVAAVQLKFHHNLIDIFTWVVRQGTHIHTQLLFSITWPEMAFGCGLALSFCCSQRYVPEAIAETYLWSARVHYPSDDGSGVTAGGVFALQWCLVAWYVSTQCIPEPTAPQQTTAWLKAWLSYQLGSVTFRRIDASSYIIYLILFLCKQPATWQHVQWNVCYFSVNIYNFREKKKSEKPWRAAPIGNRKHRQILPFYQEPLGRTSLDNIDLIILLRSLVTPGR